MSTGTTCGFKFFKKFWTVLDFLQKPLAWFSKFYLRVQSKKCVRNSFLIFLFRILSAFERKFFQTFGEKSSKSRQNYLLRVQRNNLWLERFFKSFESFCIFCRNLWRGSQISIYVSRVKLRKKQFSGFSFRSFFGIWVKNFSDFRPKDFKKLSKLPSACQTEQFVALKFLKSFEPFRIFYRNLWHGSHFSIFVSRVKIAEEINLLFFFSEFFRILSDIFSDFWPKHFKSFQNYLLHVQRSHLCL